MTAMPYRAPRDEIIPLRRMGTAWDVAYACLFLTLDEASQVTATTIVLEGGITATYPSV